MSTGICLIDLLLSANEIVKPFFRDIIIKRGDLLVKQSGRENGAENRELARGI